MPMAMPSASDVLDAGVAAEVDAFLSNYKALDPEASSRLRALPVQLQRQVLDRGDLSHARSPAAVLITRIRAVETGAGCDGAVSAVFQ